jgi:hypothetical protein
MHTRISILISAIYIAFLAIASGQLFEEFVVRGPGDLHNTAVNEYIAERAKQTDKKLDLGDDSPIMKRAKEYAIRRFSAVPDEELVILVQVIM